jgi:hypothetical protein
MKKVIALKKGFWLTQAMNNSNTNNNAASATQTAEEIKIGDRVRMISENSNWNVGEAGTVVWIGSDRVAVDFDGREDGDGYTAFLDAFVKL